MVGVKICGLTTSEAVDAVIASEADFAGFVFFPPSPRHITPDIAVQLSAPLPPRIKKVAVCVNITNEEITAMLKVFTPDYFQLHGDEPLSRITDIQYNFGIPVIKAIAVRNGDDIAEGMRYSTAADMLLFDAKAPDSFSGAMPGGNGLIFDWNLLAGRAFSVPWMLSGGLNVDNLQEAVTRSQAPIVDVSSGLETRPGIKSPALITEFVRLAKSL